MLTIEIGNNMLLERLKELQKLIDNPKNGVKSMILRHPSSNEVLLVIHFTDENGKPAAFAIEIPYA